MATHEYKRKTLKRIENGFILIEKIFENNK